MISYIVAYLYVLEFSMFIPMNDHFLLGFSFMHEYFCLRESNIFSETLQFIVEGEQTRD